MNRPTQSVAQQKRELRRLTLQRRDRLTADQRQQKNRHIVERLTELAEVRAAEVILCFASYGSEVSTQPIITWCLSEKKRLAAPRVVGPRTLEAFVVTDPQTELAVGRYGVLEPREGLERLEPTGIDLVIVPGVCFDEKLDRIGYGGGFYDSYAVRLREDALRVAVCFELQLSYEPLPVEAHDLPVDALVTEERIIPWPPLLKRDRRSSTSAS